MKVRAIYKLPLWREDDCEAPCNYQNLYCAGALVGPPWSKRENGFIFKETVPNGISLYYEPHCDYQESTYDGVESVDAIITPVVDQLLAGYPLVTLPSCHAMPCTAPISLH